MRLLLLTVITATLLCSGCATVISEQSRRLVDTDAHFSKIRATPETYIGKHVLIGGRIAAVRNSQGGAQLEIVQFELDYSGAPENSFRSHGRFIATASEYLDPLIYSRGMLITLVGEIKGKQTQRLDDMDYTYPLIAMREWHLWPENDQGGAYRFPPYAPQYNPYNYGYGHEPFLPRPFNPLYR